MKKKLNYFNREERNGMILLLFCILLFVSFIYLQRKYIPEGSDINIVYSSEDMKSDNLNEPKYRNQDHFTANVKVNTEELPLIKEVVPKTETKVNEVSSIKSISIPSDENNFNKTDSKRKSQSKKNVFGKKKNSNQKANGKKEWSNKLNNTKNYFRKKVKPFSINTTDKETWKSLYGIGPKYAERILKYQKWLGGFHSPEQLKEVYGITDSLYNELAPFLVDDEPYKRIDINAVSLDELGRHPYIYWDQAKLLLNYRRHHGDFQSVIDIYKIKELDKEQVDKLLPYLDFGIPGEEFIETVSER